MTDDRFSNPCEKVRSSCRRWMEEEPSWETNGRRSVKIHKENLPRLAKDILEKKKQNPSWIEWDEENWHYSGDGYSGSEVQRRERVALAILALDAINFCFWPPRAGDTKINSLEYDHLAVALKKMAEADDTMNDGTRSAADSVVRSSESYAFSPKNLASMTSEKMSALLQPHLDGHVLDNMSKRAELWKEVGESLLNHFDGSATELLARAEHNNASNLVELIFTYLPGFRDEVQLGTERIVFLKRAQIFVGDVNAALKLRLTGMEQLTTFADYRVPQILRYFDCIKYSPKLSAMVDSGEELALGSTEEISIRAATVTAVEELVMFLNSDEASSSSSVGEAFTDVTVDWYLWQVGERMHREKLLKPFHKVRTQFY
jgi:hypothetical protein